MTPPTGWKTIDTGGGCTAFHRAIPDSIMEWGITQFDAPTSPTSPDEPCVLTLWLLGSTVLQWHCSCLAEAVQIAEGAKP